MSRVEAPKLCSDGRDEMVHSRDDQHRQRVADHRPERFASATFHPIILAHLGTDRGSVF